MSDTKRGYLVMINGLGDGFEWEARFTGMFTTKREAMRQMRQMKADDGDSLRPRFTYAVVPVEVPRLPKKDVRR